MENIMVAPAHVAERDKVTKQAVTKQVRDLAEKSDLPVERDGRGRIVRFSLAHFDHLRERFASSEKVAAARSHTPPPSLSPQLPAGDSRDEALRQEAWLKVGRERLRQQEVAGNLVRADPNGSLCLFQYPANGVVERIHKRAMPVILTSREETIVIEAGSQETQKAAI